MAPAPLSDLLRDPDSSAPFAPRRPVGRALGGSIAVHAALFALLVWVGFHAAKVVEETPAAIDVVYLPDPGPGGGGGGNPAPVAPARLATPRPQPVPLVQPAVLPEPQPQPAPTLTAKLTTDLNELLRSNGLGHVDLGPAGGGVGSGPGPGRGSGLGPGEGGNTGDGPVRPGNGCDPPSILLQPGPRYTNDAMRAKIQGDVNVEAVVRKDGAVGDMRVVRSLDAVFGLDQEALKAARSWRFRPATCHGQPVDMIVTLVIEFRLH